MEKALAARGYTVLQFSREEPRLVMVRRMVLDLPEIWKVTASHREDCRTLGIEYDGWRALTEP